MKGASLSGIRFFLKDKIARVYHDFTYTSCFLSSSPGEVHLFPLELDWCQISGSHTPCLF